MSEMCSECGLPTELCVCTDIDRSESGTVTISVDERRYDKKMTVVEGIADSDVDTLESELKGTVGAGGTTENGVIYIQGDHRNRSDFIDAIEAYGYTVA